MNRRLAICTLPLLAVTCCKAIPDSALPPTAPAVASIPTPAPTPMPAIAKPNYENWADAPQTRGDWSYRMSAGGVSEAVFASGGARVLTLMCSPRKEVVIMRNGNGTQPMNIFTETAQRSFVMQTGKGDSTVTLAGSDPLLDAMALSRGRFAVEVGGLEPLYLPSWPEVSRLVEDCR